MPARLQAPKGTQDLLPEQTRRWQTVEALARELAAVYRFQEIRTPVFEDTALFHRGVGEATDIVSKETYTFETRGGSSITLRPEGTAPVVRALLQAGLLDQAGSVAKVYYLSTPMLRYERPQAGRFRQHHQFGIEAFGVATPEQDVECILLQQDFYRRVGLTGVRLDLNTLGDGESKRQYAAALREFFAGKEADLSDESRRRLEINPLRILDSKDPRDVAASQGVPPNADFLSDASRRHFDRVRALLTDADTPFELNANLVRGLDYYTDTLWEFVADGLGAQAAVGGGGRYDGLVETLGGKATPGVGFGMGMERLMLALDAQGVELPMPVRTSVWVVAASESLGDAVLKLVRELRAGGIVADADLTGRSVKAQFKLADRAKATHTVVMGEDEVAAGTVQLKTMSTGEQRSIPRGTVLEALSPSAGGPH
jgi:histidyl-tRNA synthetase